MNYKCQVNFSSSDHPWLAEIPVAIGVPGRDVIDEGLKLETIAGCRMVPKVGSRMGRIICLPKIIVCLNRLNGSKFSFFCKNDKNMSLSSLGGLPTELGTI